uniref:C3H1-type domain-containing protein n=1 Tax=Parascaris univalens TaxID=6257 RepID=A0A915BU53_PARUN
FLIGSLATYGQFILHPLHFLQMVEEALPTSRRRARSAVAGKVERKLSWNSVDGTAADDLRTAMESRNIAVGSPVCALLNLIDSSFSAAESALQNMKEASRDRQNVANQPLTADENSFKEQIKKTDGFKRVVPRTRSPTKPHKRSIEDVSTDTNEGTLFKAHTAVHRERSAPARLTDSSSKLITVDKETNADCVATIFPTTRSRKEEGSFSCPQRRLCSSKHISERRRIHKPKRRIQGALVAPKRRAPKDTWRIRKQHLGNIRDSERYCQDCAWKAQKIRRRHERIKTGVGDDKYVHLISRNIGKKQDTRHHILMAGQGINGAHWLTPNNDQSIAGTKFCQCSPPQTKSISEQSSETSIGSMPRRSLKCLTCDSHKRRHHHSLMKPSSRKSHNSSDPLSRRSVARVTEQCLLSDALPISQHSRKKEGCDNIGYEAHSPGISYSSPHILKNEDVRSLQRHSCRERHQLPIPTYCIECGCSYLLAKPCPIRERRSRSESSKYEDVYNHGHEVVDGRPKHDEEGAHEERSNSACDSILKHQKYKLCSRCTRGVGDSGRGCHSRPMKERFSKIPQISWIKDWSRPKLRNTRKETLYSRIALNEACSTFVRRRPSQDEVAAPAVNSPRKIATRSASATSLIPLAAIMRTISSVQSLLKGSSTMPKREKQCSKLARSQSGRRFPAAQARQTRMIKSGPYGLISRRILERCNDNQPSTSIKNISYLETLKDAYSRSAGIASGKFLPIKRSSSTVTNTTALITVPSEITSDTPLASKTIEDSALTTVKSIRSPEMQTSSEVLHAASTATSTEDIIKTVLSSRQLPALPQKRLPTLAQPIVTSKSRSSLPSYGTPPKVDRMTSKLVKREGSCLNTAVTDASSGPHAIRSKNQNSQERTMPLVRRKTTVSRKNHNGCAKGKNMPICMSAASITPKKEAFRKTNTQTLNNAEKPNAANREVSTDRSEAYVVDSTPSHLPLNEKEAFETAVTMTPHRFAETAHEKSLMTTKEVSSVAEQSTSSITASEKSPRAAVFDELHSAVEKKLSSEKPNAANREVSTARSEACVVARTPLHPLLKEKKAFDSAVAMTPHRSMETAHEKSLMTTKEVSSVAEQSTSSITASEKSPRAAVFDELHSAVEKKLSSEKPNAANGEVSTARSEACVVASTPSRPPLNEKEAFETAVTMTPHRFVETAHEKSLMTTKEVSSVAEQSTSSITASEKSPRAAVSDELHSAVEKRLSSEKPNAANREVSTARSEARVGASTRLVALKEEEDFRTALPMTQCFVDSDHENSFITAREVWTVAKRTASLITATERPPRAAVFDELHSAVEKRLSSEKPNAANREVSTARSEACVVDSTPSHLPLNEKEAFETAVAMTPHRFVETAYEKSVMTTREVWTVAQRTASLITATERPPRAAVFDELHSAVEKRLSSEEANAAANREVSTARSEARVGASTRLVALIEEEDFRTALPMTQCFVDSDHENSFITAREVWTVAKRTASLITATERPPRAAVFDELHSAVEKRLSSEKPNAANREVSTARSEACVVDSTPSHLPLNEKEAFETAVAMTPHRFVETAYEKSVMTTREVWTVAQRTASLITATERPPRAAVFDELHSAVEKRLSSEEANAAANREVSTARSEARVGASTRLVALIEEEDFRTALPMTQCFVDSDHENSFITAREVWTVAKRTASLITATERPPLAAVFDDLHSAVEKRLPSGQGSSARRELRTAGSEACVVARTPSHLVLNEKEAFETAVAMTPHRFVETAHEKSLITAREVCTVTQRTASLITATERAPRAAVFDELRSAVEKRLPSEKPNAANREVSRARSETCVVASTPSHLVLNEKEAFGIPLATAALEICVVSHPASCTSESTTSTTTDVSKSTQPPPRKESSDDARHLSMHTGKTNSCQTAQQVSMPTALQDDNESERKQASCSGSCVDSHRTLSTDRPLSSATLAEVERVSAQAHIAERNESLILPMQPSTHTGKTDSCQTAQQVSMRTALEDDNESERKQALCSGPCIVSHQTSCSSPPTSSTTTSDSGKVCKSTKRSPRKESTDAAEHLWMPIGSRTGTQLTEATYTSVLTAAAKERLQIIGDKQSVRIEAAMVYSKACPAGGSSYLGKTHKETAIIAKEPLTYIQKTNLRRTAHEISSPAAIMSDLRSASEPTLCSGLLSDMKGTWSTPPRFSIIAKETSQLDTHVELMHSEEVMVNTATLNTPLRGDILSAQRDSVCTAREPSMHLLKKPDCESTCETARKLRRLIFATRSKRAPMTTSDVQNFTPLTTKQNMEIADRGSIYQEHLRSALLHSSTRTPADKRTTNELSSITAKSDSQRSE